MSWIVVALLIATSSSGFGQVFEEVAPAGNLQALSVMGSPVQGSGIAIRVTAPSGSLAHVGVSSGTAYEAFPPFGVILVDLGSFIYYPVSVGPSGTATLTLPVYSSLAVMSEYNIQAAIDLPTGECLMTNRVRVFVEGASQNLQLGPTGPFAIDVGSTLQFNVSTTGGQGPVALSVVNPMPLAPNMSFDASTGFFSFSPDLSQIGQLDVVFSAMDAVETVTTTATITVNTPVPGTPTALSGSVADAVTEVGIAGVIVSLDGGTPSTVTAADGSFMLSGLPSGAVSIVFDGQPAGDYPTLPEPLELLAGVNNVIERPVFLPMVDPMAGVAYDPQNPAPTPVMNPVVPATSLNVMPGSVSTPAGQPFVGDITIVPVPPDNAPLGLPVGANPGQLISIQPGGIQFDPPAILTWPNDDAYQPGTELQVWSVNEQTGGFEVVGMAVVQPNGEITTDPALGGSGGIVVGSWHYVLPPGTGGDSGQEGGEDGERPMYCGNSSTELASGIFHEVHGIAPYRAMGRSQSLTLHYNSGTADPRPFLVFDAVIPQISTVPLSISTCITVGGVAGSTSYVNTTGLSENADESVRVVAQMPSSGFPTGIYGYQLEIANHFSASSVSSIVGGQAVINNRQASPVGCGWGFEEVDRLYPQPDGSILLEKGDGNTLFYRMTPAGIGGLRMRMYDTPNAFSAVQTGFAGLTPGSFSVTTQSGSQLVNEYIVPTVGFLDTAFDVSAFYHVGENGFVDPGSTALAPQGDDISIQPPGGNDSFGASFDGYVYVPLGGDVSFTVWVDDAFALYVDGALVLSHFGGCDYCPFNVTVPGLSPGYVPIRLDHGESGGEADILLQGAGGGLPGGTIPSTFLCTTPGGAMQLSSPPGDFATLTQNPDGTYTRRLVNGTEIHFDAMGFQSAIVDRNGNETAFTHDAMGRLTMIADPVQTSGNGPGHFVLRYSGSTLASITDHTGRQTLLTHDGQGRLVGVQDPDGSTRTFGYDGAGRMITQQGKNGFVTSYTYDFAGRNVEASRPDGSIVCFHPSSSAFAVDPTSGAGSSSAPHSAVRTADVVASYLDGRGNTWSVGTDRAGRLMRSVDPLGRETAIVRNAEGLATKITRPDGSVTDITYDARGNTTSVTQRGDDGVSSNDRVWTFTHDPVHNQITSIIDPLNNLNGMGATISIAYDASGNALSALDAQDQLTLFAYDEAGRGVPGLAGLPTSRTTASGLPEQGTTTWEYARSGLVAASVDPALRRVSYAYNAAGYATSVSAQGNTPSTVDDQVTGYVYDGMNRPTSMTNALGAVTTLAYWPDGNLMMVIDAKTNPAPGVTTFTYDGRGQLATRTDPSGLQESFAYDGEGSLIAKIDRAGQVTSSVSDPVGRTTRIEFPGPLGEPGNEVVTFSYQAGTDQVAMIQDVDSTVSFVWNSFGEVASTSTGGPIQPSTTITYSNDKNGNRTAMDAAITGLPSFTNIVYTYDSLDRLTSLIDSAQSVQATLGYDARSRRTSLTRILPNSTLQSNYIWNPDSKLSVVEHLLGGSQLVSRFSYTYDGVGRRQTQVQDRAAFGLSSSLQTYAHDLTGRLARVTSGATGAENYTYDEVGNRLSSHAGPAAWQYDASNRLISDDQFRYTYDANGNRTSKSGPTGTWSYTYDAQNRLVQVVVPSGTMISYAHDGLGRVISRTESGSPSSTTTYVYDGEDRVLQMGPTGVQALVHASGIDDYLFGTAGGSPFAIIQDGIGSVTDEVSANGVITFAALFDSFGGTQATMGSALTTFSFTGRDLDPATGIHYFRMRSYDSRTGRFLQEDPIAFAGRDWNLYSYVQQSPTSWVDPYGLSPLDTVNDLAGDAMQAIEDAVDSVADAVDSAVDGVSDAVGAADDFLDNYGDMVDANTIGADKYFHCMANCQAASRGGVGESTAEVISDIRELVDEYVKGDSSQACQADQAANQTGRQGGSSGQSCSQTCAPLRPKGLPSKY